MLYIHRGSILQLFKKTDESHKYNIGQKKQTQNSIILYNPTYIKCKNGFSQWVCLTNINVMKATTKSKPNGKEKISINTIVIWANLPLLAICYRCSGTNRTAMDNLEKEAAETEKGSFKYSWVSDKLKAECKCGFLPAEI